MWTIVCTSQLSFDLKGKMTGELFSYVIFRALSLMYNFDYMETF